MSAILRGMRTALVVTRWTCLALLAAFILATTADILMGTSAGAQTGQALAYLVAYSAPALVVLAIYLLATRRLRRLTAEPGPASRPSSDPA